MKRAISIFSLIALAAIVVLVAPGIALADHDYYRASAPYGHGGPQVQENYSVNCTSQVPGSCHQTIYGGHAPGGYPPVYGHPQPVYSGHGAPNLRVPGALIGGAIGSKSRRHPVQGAIIGGTAGYLGGMLIEMFVNDAQRY